jgi:hypothetical protein
MPKVFLYGIINYLILKYVGSYYSDVYTDLRLLV